MFVYVYCLSKRRFLLLFLLLLFCVSVARWGVRSVEQSVMNGGPGIWHRNTHARKRTSTLRNTGGRQAGKEAIRRTCFLVVIMLEARPLRLEPITIPPVELCYSTFLRTIYT